ncbi:MAG: 16S rRNA (uracil(1498)-N(3))-methyltransferase [Peptococcia bacterium]|jgi:16S rRNA (uracil1498-N3)-methyltransferase
MHRFYVAPEDLHQDQDNYSWVVIKGQEFEHLSRVLRILPGKEVAVFDGTGKEYVGKVVSLEKGEALVNLGKPSLFPRESPLEVWLVQGLSKGEKMDLIIQKATELGVRGIIPLKTRRCVVKLEGKKEVERRKRWQKVALEAVKQCHRTLIPTVSPVHSLEEFLQELPVKRRLFIPWEKGGSSFRCVLEEGKASKTIGSVPVYLLIGPEGGFAEEEVEQVQSYGGIPISLGPRILRTETASLAALAVLMYAWGDWG